MPSKVGNPSKHNKRAIIAAMLEMGVNVAVAHYSGGGDEGQFDRIEFDGKAVPYSWGSSKAEYDKFKQPVVKFKESQYRYDPPNYTAKLDKVTEKKMPLSEAIEQMAHDFLSALNIDWYSDNGGQGRFTINRAEGTFILSHEENVLSTEDSEHML